MLDKIKESIGNSLDDLKIKVVEAYLEKQEGNETLCIVLDREDLITVDEVVEATKIINPLIDKMADFKNIEILDIYAKPKDISDEGDVK